MAELRQLPFAFPHTPHLTEADFLPSPGNRRALEFVGNTAKWPAGRLLVWGGPGSGKTHLLHIWARNHGAGIVAGAELRQPFWPEGPVAVDDVDRVPSEPALLHLLNAAAEGGHTLLLTAGAPPGRVRTGLPDLASRLRATVAIAIGPADEAFLASLFARLLAEHQLVVTPALQAFLLKRLPRTPRTIVEAVSRLDRAALAAGSGVTRNLATQALADLFHDDLISPEA